MEKDPKQVRMSLALALLAEGGTQGLRDLLEPHLLEV